MQARHLIVTGGTGYIGTRLVDLALAQGRSVTLLGRRPGPAGTRHLAWTLGDRLPVEASDPTLPPDRQSLVHLAHDWSDTGLANVDGTSLLFEGAGAAGVDTKVFISSQSARCDALNRYGRTKWAVEQRIADATSLRVGLVYGGPRAAMYGLLCRLTRLPVLPMVDPRRMVQPIHLDEVVQGILAAADGRAGGVLALAGPEEVPFGDVLRAMARAFGGRRLRIVPVPVRLALLACDITAYIPLIPTVDRERVLGLAGTEPIQSEFDLLKLGVRVRPLADGLAQEPAGRRALLAEARQFFRCVGIDARGALLRRYARAMSGGAIERPHFLLRAHEPFGASTILAKRLRIGARLAEASREGETMLARGSRPGRLFGLALSMVADALRVPTRLIATILS